MDASMIDFDQYYVLGTSLSDTGNVLNLSESLLPNFPFYSPGRFTGGWGNGGLGGVWIDYFAEELSLDIENSSEYTLGLLPAPDSSNPFPDGVNFAVGGALTGRGENVGQIPLGLADQVDMLTGMFGPEKTFFDLDNDDSLADDLVFYEGGTNDYLKAAIDKYEANPSKFKFTRREINRVVDSVEANIFDSLTRLVDKGAENIAVFFMPDLGKTPLARSYGTDFAKALSNLSNAHNDRLDNLLDSLRGVNPEINFINLKANQLFQDVLKNPADFGFTNATASVTATNLYTGGFPDFDIRFFELDNNGFPAIDEETGLPIIDFKSSFSLLLCEALPKAETSVFWDSVHPTTRVHSILSDYTLGVLDGALKPPTVSV